MPSRRSVSSWRICWRQQGGEETIRNLSRQLRQTDFFDALRREGIGDKRVFESFVGLFPTVFSITGSGATRAIRLK